MEKPWDKKEVSICNRNCSRCSNYHKPTNSCQNIFMKPMYSSMIEISEILKHTNTCSYFSDKNYEDACRISRVNDNSWKPKDRLQISCPSGFTL